jgi:hypothetical protein
MLEVVSPADGIKLHSIATGSGTSAYANITPLTELLIARVTHNSPESSWASNTPANLEAQLTPGAIQSAQRELASGLTGIVDPTIAGNYLTTPFKAATSAQPDGGDATDKVLDVLMSRFGKDGFNQLVFAAAYVSIDPRTLVEADLKQRFTQALLLTPSPVGKALLPAEWLITGFSSSVGNGTLSLGIGFNTSDLKTVTAIMNGVSTELKYSTSVLYNPMGSRYGSLPGWAGALPVPHDLPQGKYPVTIAATDTSGKTGSITVNVVSNSPPSITLKDFIAPQIAWPSVRLIANCTDDDVRGCASITASINGKKVAQGTTGIDTVIDLKEYDRSSVSVQIAAEDTTGMVTYAYTPGMMVEGSLPLDKVAEVPGAIWDIDATRILHYDEATNTLYLRDRSSATDQIVVAQPYNADKTNRLHSAVLTPTGVAYTASAYTTGYYPMLYSVENGINVALGEASYTANIAGQYLFWRDSRPWATLSRRDLLTQKTTVLSTTAGSSSMSNDGSVTFNDDTYNIAISRPDGSKAWITSDATVALHNVDPVSDGTNFVYRKERSPSYKLVLNTNGVERELTPEIWESQPLQPGSGYQITNGWVAYLKKDDKGLRQVWRINPQGEAAKLTSFGPSQYGFNDDTYIEGLGDDGMVTVRARGRRYLVGPTSSVPRDIGPEGRNFYVNGQLHVAIGRSVYSVRK